MVPKGGDRVDPIDFKELEELHNVDQVNEYLRLGWRHFHSYTTISSVCVDSVDVRPHYIVYWPREAGDPVRPEKTDYASCEMPF